MRRDWYLAEEHKENLAHMFMSRHANPNLRSGSMRIPTISSIEKNMPYLTSDSTVVLNPLPQRYESWLLCKQSPVATTTRPAETWPWSPLQHAFWSRDFSLFEILMSYGNVPPAADIFWMFQGMIYSLMTSPVEIFCHFRRTDWLNLLALSPGQPQFRALRSPIALAWTLALLRECALSLVKILETDDVNCLCYSGTDAPSHDLRGSCKGLKQRDVSQLAWDIWSLGINRDHLLEMVDARRWHPRYGSHRIMVATVCLEEAVLAAELRIVSALLDLNIEGIIRPETLIMAVSLTEANHVSSAILEKLLQKSTPLPCRPVPTNPRLESPTGLLQHATCKPKDKNTNLGGLAGHRGYPHCRDPLQYAICTSNLPALRIFSRHPLPCPLTTLYINEATLRLDVQVLSLLLIRNPACRSEDPPIFLLKNLHDICNGVADLRYHHVAGTSHLGVRFSQLTRWMACAVALMRTGVDLDRAVDERGKSARGYIDEYQGYQGPNRFLREVARRGARLLA
ncbi:uncharacterized protein PODANS_5_10360 [Podospora anserina S mat+]|uniref:Podospora anserina S mat+ genomic DNA chromosome 5, supercontig 10 n=1 Tax=Podospora anserina (strain S / ATCC MYA-4624 / DSM 980 / FGSC 10383) TaxID=515849 RepID=B2APH6_PODAN|nr:uncharacterized protein PODANS_5_10360 [Podospora anserina S mat+]CAP65820.1 unnamed protein product [Podospora anserina S mat+]CDP30317.1 Putative protein of unknown function [Podospora anserina S mat+]